MTFTEKANLAKQYLNIFSTHHLIFIVFGIIIIIMGVILGCGAINLITKKHCSSLLLGIPAILCVFCGIIMSIVSWDGDIPKYLGSHRTEPNSAQIDVNIATRNHRLPIYKHRAKVDYRESLKLHGAKKYCVDHAYCKAHHYELVDKRYLQSHKPRTPWINH